MRAIARREVPHTSARTVRPLVFSAGSVPHVGDRRPAPTAESTKLAFFISLGTCELGRFSGNSPFLYEIFIVDPYGDREGRAAIPHPVTAGCDLPTELAPWPLPLAFD